MDKFFGIVALAILVEGIVTYFAELRKEWNWSLAAPIFMGIFVAVAYGLDLPKELGIEAHVPYVGQVLTGIIMARGSNYLYDVIGKLTGGNNA